MPIVNGKVRCWRERLAASILASRKDLGLVADVVLAGVSRRSDAEVEDLCARILAARKIKKHICKNPVRKAKQRADAYPMPEERVIV